MSLSPLWRTRLFAAGAAIVAVAVGVAVANNRLFWPVTLSVGIVLFVLAQAQSRPLSAVLLCVAVFGYIVGNRGFAQFMLIPGVPLLPAEAVLLLAGALLAVHSAWRHELPLRRDALNLLLLVWIVAGTVRVGFDYRLHGFVALRDFATVYYALFFYLAQELSQQERSRRALLNTMLISCAVLFGTSLVYERYHDFFFNVLTIGGSPLIAYKGDLIGTFLAVGSVLFFLRYEAGRGRWNVAASLLCAGAVVGTNNRASLLGLLVAALWLAIGRRWRFAATLGVTGAAAALALLLVVGVTNTSWEKTPLFGFYEHATSLLDPAGQRSYRGEGTANKGDNNLFRAVWWQEVFDETLAVNPYTGLGFGHDLAARFVQAYYPESGDEFNVRSPHNVLLTVFARMGLVGLGLFVAVIAVVAVRTARAVRAGPQEAAPWCAVWVILTSACFGVVLEGPMGAVVFWTLLGVAHATPSAANVEPASASDPAAEQPAIESAEVAPTFRP